MATFIDTDGKRRTVSAATPGPAALAGRGSASIATAQKNVTTTASKIVDARTGRTKVTAETPVGVAYRNDASIEEGSAGLTQVTIYVQRIPKTVVASVLGAVLPVIVPVTTPVWLNIFIRATA